MSYARNGPDSDVYVYHDVGGYYRCCWCPLDGDYRSPRAEGMAAHLRRHIEQGHRVPEGVIPEILADGDIATPAT